MVQNTSGTLRLMEIPVRPCCGQRHWTMQCPDGKVMCCLCFSRFELEELNIDDDGRREDVCVPCARREREVMRRLAEGICTCPRYHATKRCRHLQPYLEKEDVDVKEEYL